MPYITIKTLGGYWTIADLAKRLEINRDTLQGRVTRGTFPEPTHTVTGGRRKYYTEEEARNILMAYGKEVEINKEVE